jgi:hypothetical protein
MKKFLAVLVMLIIAFMFLMAPAFAAVPDGESGWTDESTSIVSSVVHIFIGEMIKSEAASLMGARSKRVGNLQPLLIIVNFVDHSNKIEDMSASGGLIERANGMGLILITHIDKPETSTAATSASLMVKEVGCLSAFV